MAAAEAVAAGASIIHLHARDDQGRPTQDVDRFARAIAEIRGRAPEAVVNLSTGGAIGEDFESRLRPLELRPETASLNMGSMNFMDGVFLNPVGDIEAFAGRMYELGIVPELEVYEVGMLEQAGRMRDRRVLREPLRFQFVLGVPGGMSGEVDNLLCLLRRMESLFGSHSVWGVAGIGRYEFPLAAHAMVLGGHIRVGFEDNIFIRKGVPAESNAQLVERVRTLAEWAGRPLADGRQVRSELMSS